MISTQSNHTCRICFNLLIGTIFFLSIFDPCVLFSQGTLGEGLPLASVRLQGNHHFATGLLKEQLFLLPPSGLHRLKFWHDPVLYRESLMQRDLRSLQQFYQRDGFIQATIQPLLKKQSNEKIILTYQIEEGHQVIIDSVRIDALESVEIVHQVLNKAKLKLTCKSGNGFRDEDVKMDMNTLTAAFTNAGYAYAQTRVRPILDADKNSARIIYEIAPGPACFFGPVTITGDTLVDISIVHKQMTFRTDQPYSQEKLEKTQRQIYQLGIYQFVTVKAAMDSVPNRILPVGIQVKAAPAWTIKVGAGYSHEDQFRTFLDIRRQAFLRGARRLSFYFKYSHLEPYHFDVKLTQAGFPAPQASLLINPFFLRQNEPGFIVDRTGANIAFQQRFATFTDGFLRYTLEQNYLKVSSLTRDLALDSSNIALYHKSSVSLGMARDNSTPLFNPEKGLFTATTLIWTGVGFRSDFHYIKMILEARHYLRLNRSLILASRVKVGNMQPLFEDQFTPIEDRFYAGGSMSVRGWPYAGLGPQSNASSPLGGNSLLEISCEVRFPLWGPLSGVAFMDAGNVWSRVNGQRIDQLHAAAGSGLRFRTPIGPIRLDFGWPIAESGLPMQVHLSVGQAF